MIFKYCNTLGPPGQCTVLEVGIIITNVQWRQELANPQTREYTMLKSNLSTDVSGPNLLFFFFIFKLLNRITILVDLVIYIHKFNKLSV